MCMFFTEEELRKLLMNPTQEDSRSVRLLLWSDIDWARKAWN